MTTFRCSQADAHKLPKIDWEAEAARAQDAERMWSHAYRRLAEAVRDVNNSDNAFIFEVLSEIDAYINAASKARRLQHAPRGDE